MNVLWMCCGRLWLVMLVPDCKKMLATCLSCCVVVGVVVVLVAKDLVGCDVPPQIKLNFTVRLFDCFSDQRKERSCVISCYLAFRNTSDHLRFATAHFPSELCCFLKHLKNSWG